MLVAGCATTKPGPTLADVEKMVQAQVSDSVIINKIEHSDVRYNLTVEQIIALKKEGVSDAVINAMLKTNQRPVYHQEIYYYDPWPWWGWGPYYYQPVPRPHPHPHR